MYISPTVFAVPFFASMIAIETYLSVRKEETYDRRDVWTNIALGFGSVFFGAAFGLIQAFFYELIYLKLAPFHVPMNTWWAWVLLLFADDFVYYWFHRTSHEVRFFWNFHVVHHSSNQFNLSVAVRQSWFSGSAHWIFYCMLGLLGFPLWSFVFMHGLNLIYQFWIHTKTIKKLPAPIEFIFNTPSHHRVHHGVNDQYLDKNYAGILIIWDRMFGTYVEETETPRYGIIKPIGSYNWLWINSHGWAEMFAAIKAQKTFLGKIRCIFGSPNMEF
jgi:sterol desaturase/sphingolipid hydroxylase (fatty acid hydroxylase superfamily)